MTFFRRTDCRLCKSTRLNKIFSLKPTPPGDLYLDEDAKHKSLTVYPIDLYICSNCGYVHLRDVLSPSEIYPEYLYETTSSSGLVHHFSRYADEVKSKFANLKGKLALDIGSNDGTLLSFFKENGLKVLGVDPAENVANKAQKKGIDTIIDFFSFETARKIKARYGKASLVTANNVFANLDDIENFVEAIKEIISPDGIFIIEFAYLGDLVRNQIFDYIYHEHLSYFSLNSLEKFFSKHQLRLIHLNHSTSKGGSYRAYFSSISSHHPESPEVQEGREQEKLLKLTDSKIYTSLLQNVMFNAREVQTILRQARLEGKTCVGYGASVTSTTLLYQFDIACYFDYLVDDNPAKIGTFSPGYHIPVFGQEKLINEKPDLCIILAWRYAEQIISKLKKAECFNTKFVVPMPKVEFF
jgi:SAM-dependent methyltransferase